MIRALVNQKNTNGEKIVWLLWSWVLPVVIFFVVGLKFSNNTEVLTMLKSVGLINGIGVVFCLVLLPLNIGIEAWKWQFTLKPIQQQSVWSCIKIILAGKSLNVVSPFGIGDGFSRYLGLSKKNRNQIFASLAIDRFSQLLPTLSFGLVSVFFLVEQGLAIPMTELSITLVIAFSFATLLVVGLFICKGRIRQYLLLFASINLKFIFAIAGLSFGRYFVFVLQFCLIFWALGIQLPLSTILHGVFWVFLIKTLIPNLSVLGDLVKRELSATLFFSFFISDLSVVIMASFLVWVINIVLPALLGVLFVSDLKKSF